MFSIIDKYDNVRTAYGTFVDEDGEIRFIVCDPSGHFFMTEAYEDYRLYEGD